MFLQCKELIGFVQQQQQIISKQPAASLSDPESSEFLLLGTLEPGDPNVLTIQPRPLGTSSPNHRHPEPEGSRSLCELGSVVESPWLEFWTRWGGRCPAWPSSSSASCCCSSSSGGWKRSKEASSPKLHRSLVISAAGLGSPVTADSTTARAGPRHVRVKRLLRASRPPGGPKEQKPTWQKWLKNTY